MQKVIIFVTHMQKVVFSWQINTGHRASSLYIDHYHPYFQQKIGALQQWYWLWKRHTSNYLSPRPTEVICKFPVAGFKCDTSLSFKVLLPVKTSPFVSAAQREDMCQELGLFTHSSRIFLLDKFNPLRQRHWGSVAEDRLFSDMYSDQQDNLLQKRIQNTEKFKFNNIKWFKSNIFIKKSLKFHYFSLLLH